MPSVGVGDGAAAGGCCRCVHATAILPGMSSQAKFVMAVQDTTATQATTAAIAAAAAASSGGDDCSPTVAAALANTAVTAFCRSSS